MIACKNSENLKQRKTVQESHPDGIHIESILPLVFQLCKYFLSFESLSVESGSDLTSN